MGTSVMASSWGVSWGASWGNSWGQFTSRPQKIYQEIWIIEGKPSKSVRRKQKKARKIAHEIEEIIKGTRDKILKGTFGSAQTAQLNSLVYSKALELSYEYERIGQTVGFLKEAIAAKQQAIERIEATWKRLQREAERREEKRQQAEQDDLETLYLLMVTL